MEQLCLDIRRPPQGALTGCEPIVDCPLPQNTIGVHSYSKYFGRTGWRLGVIAIHENNIFDMMIAKLPDKHVKALFCSWRSPSAPFSGASAFADLRSVRQPAF